MNLNMLQIFCSVAELLSISKAAKHLHLSQPAVSAQIHSLENYYDTQLFFRNTKGVKLTPNGEIVYKNAKQILAIDSLTKERLEAFNHQESIFRLGATELIGNFALPCTLTKFRNKNPNIQINLEIAAKDKLLSLLLSQQIDLAIIDDQISLPSELESILIGKDSVLLAVSINSPFSSKKSLSLSELEKISLILPSSVLEIRNIIEQRLYQLKISLESLNIVSEMSSIQALKSAVISGLGASFFSKSCIERDIQAKVLSPLIIKNLQLEIPYYIIYNPHYASITAQKFISFLKEIELFDKYLTPSTV